MTSYGCQYNIKPSETKLAKQPHVTLQPATSTMDNYIIQTTSGNKYEHARYNRPDLHSLKID